MIETQETSRYTKKVIALRGCLLLFSVIALQLLFLLLHRHPLQVRVDKVAKTEEIAATDSVERIRVEEVLFLHIGKAGGGTFVSEAKNYNVTFPHCHPHPCVDATYELLTGDDKDNAVESPSPTTGYLRATGSASTKSINKGGGGGYVLVSLRDPVDRFVSSFYWRQKITCDPENGDTRRAPMPNEGGGLVSNQPDLYCNDRAWPPEKEVLFHRYNRDADALARALCSADEAVAEQARKDILSIGHAKHKIVDWLGPDWSEYADSIFPVILEPSFDYEEQVDDSVRWVYDKTHFEEETLFEHRQSRRMLSRVEIIEEEKDGAAADFAHSSSSLKKPLSEAGARCVAQYYAEDYAVLEPLRDLACKSDVCRQAVQSILDRRTPL